MKTEYEILINEISTYRSDEIIILILDFFKKLEMEGKIFAYWYFLSLIHLSVEYSSTSKFLLPPSYHDIKRMGKRVEKIQSDYILNNFGLNERNLRKSMSIIMNQQFWQFNNIPEYDITKQRFLFNHPKILNLFFQKHNIELNDFLDLCMFTFLYVENKEESKYNGYLDSRYIACLEHYKGKSITIKYLDAISIKDTYPLKKQFLTASKVKSGIYKMLDFSHLITKPILYIHQKYHVYHKQILFNSFKYFVYDSLKHEQGFGECFGKKTFENYVELGLQDKGIRYIRDTELKKKLNKASKNVDFLIEEKILIECKATELVPHIAVNPTDEMLKKALKASIVKGFKQIIENANELSIENCIGVIVTYKNIRIDGDDALKEILKNRNNWFSKEQLEMLPENNFLIFNIDDWDLIVSSTDNTLEELLRGIIKKQKKHRKQLSDYIYDLNKEDKPYTFLQEKYNEFNNQK